MKLSAQSNVIMRIKFAKLTAFFIIAINIIVVYYTLHIFYASGGFNVYTSVAPKVKPTTKSPAKSIGKWVTVVIRDFETNENDVTQTAYSFIKLFPSIQILILYDELPYPPLDLSLSKNSTFKNVQTILMSPTMKIPYTEWYPIHHIKTKYVLFVPDSTRISTRKSLQTMVTELLKQPDEIVVAPFARQKELKCLNVNINLREWTLRYSSIKNTICDAVSGKHVTLMKTEYLHKLPNAFLLPFPHSLYVQTSSIFIKIRILKGIIFYDGKAVFKSHHAQWRKQQKDHARFKKLYQTLKFKQVVRETGTTEWYGCNRDTSRCFPSVLDSMPSYLYEDRWTPPCCLSNLRKTAKHVFNILDEVGIRYWLESGSLLGAMRSGDILPWDHDVDVGFNTDDLSRSQWLLKAKEKPVVDTKGFLWEKATEGNFYRVYYSKVNKINVNLFPFYSMNGSMVPDSWYTSHKNMEFPDNFLHPMSSIEFVGRHVPSPNNIREFLELKFGKGCIENPKYPDPHKLPFP